MWSRLLMVGWLLACGVICACSPRDWLGGVSALVLGFAAGGLCRRDDFKTLVGHTIKRLANESERHASA